MMPSDSKINIVITGANGQIGFALNQVLGADSLFQVNSYGKDELDITDSSRVRQVLEDTNAKYLINTAAYTNVDQAESDKDKAMSINGHALQGLSIACREFNCHLIHFSSEYVYDSIQSRAIKETDPTSPKSVYAQSKLLGDNNIMLHTNSYTIIRTSWVYGPEGNNFVNTMLRLAKSKSKLSVVDDQIGAPTYTLDIAEMVAVILNSKHKNPDVDITGIFNFSNEAEISWKEFAETIFKAKNLDVHVQGISSREYGAKAERPSWSVLSKNKIYNTFGVGKKDWKLSLFDYLKNYS